MQNHRITNKVIELIENIANKSLKVSTEDERNWFDIKYEISSYMAFETEKGDIIYIHNDFNELGEIVGIHFTKTGKPTTVNNFHNILEKMYFSNIRGYDLDALKEKVGVDTFNNFVKALQDCTNSEGTYETRMKKRYEDLVN